MNQRKKENTIHEKLTLAEARARIHEFEGLKKIEGKGGGAAIRPNGDSQASAPKAKR